MRLSLMGHIMLWRCSSAHPSVCDLFLVQPVTFKVLGLGSSYEGCSKRFANRYTENTQSTGI